MWADQWHHIGSYMACVHMYTPDSAIDSLQLRLQGIHCRGFVPMLKIKKRVTLVKIPMCAVSAVFIWSNHVHYQLLNCLPHVFVPRPNCLPHVLVPRPFENGSSLFVNLEFQKLRAHLRLLGYYSCLTGCL